MNRPIKGKVWSLSTHLFVALANPADAY